MVDNIFNLLLELNSGRTLTAQYLAAKLNISRRSVYRYCDILSTSNIPIVTIMGKNGGIKIAEEYMLSSMYFSPDELSVIKLALAEYSGDDVAKSALTKLVSLKNSSQTINLSNIINICNSASGGSLDVKIKLLDAAISAKNIMSICYHGRNGTVTTRKIAPLNFIVADGEWYIYCFCYMRQEYRTFKLSRISNFYTESTRQNIPDNYPKTWSFGSESKLNIVLKVYVSAKYMVEEWLGLEQLLPITGDEFFVNTYVDNNQDLISKLLSFGEGVTVVSPAELKDAYISRVSAMCLNYNQ